MSSVSQSTLGHRYL